MDTGGEGGDVLRPDRNKGRSTERRALPDAVRRSEAGAEEGVVLDLLRRSRSADHDPRRTRTARTPIALPEALRSARQGGSPGRNEAAIRRRYGGPSMRRRAGGTVRSQVSRRGPAVLDRGSDQAGRTDPRMRDFLFDPGNGVGTLPRVSRLR